MIPYIIYVALVTAVYFLVYRLLLHKETFFRLNRWFFLAGVICSFALPLLPVPASWSLRMHLSDNRPAPASAQQSATQPEYNAGGAGFADLSPGPGHTATLTSSMVPAEPATPVKLAHTHREHASGNGHAYRNSRLAAQAAAPSKSTGTNAQPSALSTATFPGLVSTSGRAQASTPEPVNLRPVNNVPEKENTFSFSSVLMWVYYAYLGGVLLFGLNLLLQLIVLWFQVRSNPVRKEGIFRIVTTRGNRAPCSFGKYIFINPGLYDEETYQQILTHEKIHVQQRHSLDIMLGEFLMVIQWFNPFAWFYRKALEDNLEFLTDASMIRNPRINASRYQLSLLRVSAPHLPLSITSNYNQSLLKKRILMMHVPQSPARTTWKYFVMLPLLVGMASFFNHTLAVGAASVMGAIPGQQVIPAPQSAPAAPQAQAAALPGDTGKPGAEQRAQVQQSIDRNLNYSFDHNINYRLDYQYSPAPFIVNLTPFQGGISHTVATNIQATVDAHLNQAFHMSPMPVNINLADVHGVGIQTNVASNVDVQVYRDWMGPDHNTGSWMATIYGDTVEMTLKSGDEDNNWVNTERFMKSDFSSLPTQKGDFTVTREAGVLNLNGYFDGNEGFGHYVFHANKDFQDYLQKTGIKEVTDERMFGVFMANVTRRAVGDLATAGYGNITVHELTGLCAMKVDAAYIQSWKSLGYNNLSPHELISLKAMKVDGAFVRGLQSAGFKDLGAHDLVAAKSMNITPEYVHTWDGLGFKDLSLHDLIALKSMNVDGSYLKELQAAGLKDLSAHDLVSAKSMEISGAYVQSWNQAGYPNLEMHDLVGLKSMKVDPAYIKSLKDAGVKEMSIHEAVSAKSMDITPAYVQSWAQSGYKDLSIHELIALKSMKIDGGYVKSWKDMGYGDLSSHDLVSLKSVGVDGDYIKSMQAAGYSHLEPHELVAFKSMNISPDFVKGYTALGFKDIPPHTLMELKSMDVTPEYITAMKNKGFNSADLQEYVKLKTFK